MLLDSVEQNANSMHQNLCLPAHKHVLNRYAMMEMGYDCPDLPVGTVTDLHLERCELAIRLFYVYCFYNIRSSDQESIALR